VQYILIAKPTMCTKFSNLFYFRITIYMFRIVFSSIIRSSSLHIQQQYLFDIYLLLYVQS
jgi:hypothetical protein